ncbi:UDP-2,3-diacylglucosamine diphosphatase [Thiotrichales bacterium HSG1]|nr:UDP-2,3-diacylglucosamine diphosphatase [Thiotrichales bacterium HSG1]
METLFIADLHLSSDKSNDLALKFLSERAKKADALYILGDLFETWLGDDEPNYQEILTSLYNLTIPVFIMHGNRDFLLGKKFSAITGCQLIPDHYIIDLYGIPTLLMHGDTLCTLDIDYQAFRKQVRDPNWQKFFLSQPLEVRRKLAKQARDSSQLKVKNNIPKIMDVTPDAVNQVLLKYNVNQLIHGHTHLPKVHKEGDRTRWVLGNWTNNSAVVLSCNSEQCQLIDIVNNIVASPEQSSVV